MKKVQLTADEQGWEEIEEVTVPEDPKAAITLDIVEKTSDGNYIFQNEKKEHFLAEDKEFDDSMKIKLKKYFDSLQKVKK